MGRGGASGAVRRTVSAARIPPTCGLAGPVPVARVLLPALVGALSCPFWPESSVRILCLFLVSALMLASLAGACGDYELWPQSFRLVPDGDGPALAFVCLDGGLTVFLENDGAELGDIEVLILEGLEPLTFQQHKSGGNQMISLNPGADITGAFLAAEAGSGWLQGGNEAALFGYDARGFGEKLELLACRW